MANNSNSAAIAAAQEAGRNAASDWDAEGPSLEDHRLRSLMNFERDVVKSTADDREALPQWRAFLDAFDKQAFPNGVNPLNSDESDPVGLRMDPIRARRFGRTLSAIARAVHSLEAAQPHFAGLDVDVGRMDPGQTIRAFIATMNQDINLVFQMLANEEAAGDSNG